ncbi:MAG: tRNA adenosine(34) deaminase TadA [Rhodothermaceae bacterium]|nr:tRNA adenosine(34) deaminase TadA [Rhodothermaceae bacterium]
MSLSALLEPDRRWMKVALQEAERAFDQNEVPVGAVIVRKGQIVGRGRNMVEQLNDPTAHAEMIAITAACETLGVKYLDHCTMYVTIEPCPMCAGALVWSKLQRLVFGAYEEKAGSAGSMYNITQDRRLNHVVDVVSGVEMERAAGLMQDFFRQRRALPKD